MSDDDKGRDPDYEPDFSTVNMKDLGVDDGADISEDDEIEGRPKHSEVEDSGQVQDSKPLMNTTYRRKPGKDRRTSLLWTKFTIVNEKEQIAECNICHARLSIRSTSSNLKKHLERKHGFSIKLGIIPKRANQPKYITPTPRPKVSQLAGISDEGITVKVVGENGEEEHFQLIGDQFLSEEVVHEDVQEEHDYSTPGHRMEEEHGVEVESEPLKIGKVRSLREQSSQSKRGPPQLYLPHQTFTSHMDEKTKRQRIMELQMECLENKKYNMQMEALLMEQQLNLPRSIFTEPLHYKDAQTRSTQTEVGGSDTRVFYVSDKRGGRPIQQLFALQDLDF